jgi:hypothetical protein
VNLSARVAKLWADVESKGRPAAEKLLLVEAGKASDSCSVLVGIDGNERRHLCVSAPRERPGQADRYSRGVTIEVRELVQDGQLQQFIDVTCLIPELNKLFEIVTGEMLGALQADSASSFKKCHDILERWRALLEKERSGALSREELAALMAELIVLDRLTEVEVRALQGWLGPEKAVHDFVCGQIDIEVKSTLRTTGRIVEINDLAQLAAPAGGDLYLGLVRLRYAPKRGRSVPDLIDALIDRGVDEVLLFQRLASVGYDPVLAEAYRATTFEVVEEFWYRVDDAFPRITAASFRPGLPPPVVTKISYTLNLDADDPAPMAAGSLTFIKKAAEAFA